MKQSVFLSYDLGFQGDYPKLYEWLDAHGAIECGDSFCRFDYDFNTVQHVLSDEDTWAMVKEIREDLIDNVNFSNTDRVYLVSEFYVKGQKKMAGIFLIGKRKQANPWDGASHKMDYQQDIDE